MATGEPASSSRGFEGADKPLKARASRGKAEKGSLATCASQGGRHDRVNYHGGRHSAQRGGEASLAARRNGVSVCGEADGSQRGPADAESDNGLPARGAKKDGVKGTCAI